MNSDLILSILLALLPGFLFFTIIYAVAVKVLEPRLTFVQSLLISAVGSVVLIAVYAAYTLSKSSLGLDSAVDALAAIVAWIILAIVITRLARNYGIEKKDWLGVGGKANLWLLALSWIIIGFVYGLSYFMRG